MEIEKGKTYTAYKQSTAMTPDHTEQVTVVWIDGENVHYRLEGDTKVKQTTIERFTEIVTPPKRRW